jgi:hypothetical protein
MPDWARPSPPAFGPRVARLDLNVLPGIPTQRTLRTMPSIPRVCLSITFVTGLSVGAQQASTTVSAGRQQNPPSPGARSGHSLVYDAALKRLVVVDGYLPPHDSSPAELWSWDGQRWTLLPGSGSGPSKRIVGAAVFDVRRGRLVSFGGSNSSLGILGDTWEWNGAAWTERSDTSIGRRDHHALAYDEARGKTVLFGGNAGPGPWPSDTWEWNGDAWTRAAIEGPPGRSRTTMVYDDARRQMVLFGGAGAPPGPKQPIVVFGDTWVWNGAAWRRVTDPSPPPRYAHAMAFDRGRGVAVMYGGAKMTAEGQTVHLEDMWQWNGQRWTEIRMTGPTPGKRYSPAMAFDASRDRIVLHGGLEVTGRGAFTRFDDLWEWDGASWARVH